MAEAELHRVLQHLRNVLIQQDAGRMTDEDLLRRYLEQRDEAAFEALVRRHGPMVLGVCRRVLRNLHDAEDAFQATFLVLVRKASSLRAPNKVGNWLYGVASRTAQEARRAISADARRRAIPALLESWQVWPRSYLPYLSSSKLDTAR
jgi:DNA-directed RNA polymerase specialized sigma24 family protein